MDLVSKHRALLQMEEELVGMYSDILGGLLPEGSPFRPPPPLAVADTAEEGK